MGVTQQQGGLYRCRCEPQCANECQALGMWDWEYRRDMPAELARVRLKPQQVQMSPEAAAGRCGSP